MNKNKCVSVVFSFRNEESNITELVKRTSCALESIDSIVYELVFVNDASTDGSLEILLMLSKEHPITIVNMSRRFGVTPCVLAGFEIARGDVIVYMDSDLQDPPELIPSMYDEYLNGADVVHMTRTRRHGEHRLKMIITRIAYKIINIASEIPIKENTGDFKLLSKRVVQKILSLKEYDPFMRGLSVWVGFKQKYINYERNPRHSGLTKFPLISKGPVNEFLRGVTAYSAAPLYISFGAGVLTLFFSVFLGIYAVISKILDLSVPGTSGILLAIAFFSSIIMLNIGVMGVYIARIYYQTKERPRYIIDTVVRNEA